ncbi:sigma-54-dependent transcriptional regulator [Methylobacterium organophilum]|uniref:C4-dicarboxylate transport transcriptional regulatory protein DctD n=1 Tax=Methylobacterium organophilum TaxID=410 RepID=A0ABQ4T609_METOR|nr:sigma-54 dependent transcriptional regulator [Methylobacterium organophilum]GJE25869.1 C4-dicarboxylate transport transcriptional regulatory protein DctD [Methylobacterium organophilum]
MFPEEAGRLPARPKVVLVDDEEMIRLTMEQTLQLAGLSVETFASAEEALPAIGRDFPGVVVSDVRLPGRDGLELLADVRRRDPELPVVLITGHGDIAMAVSAMREGAYDFIEKPFVGEAFVEIVRRALEKRALVMENRRLRTALDRGDAVERCLVGQSPAMRRLRDDVTSLAFTAADVLVLGETGAGKEQVARALHEGGNRRDKPFVAVNCGAIPESMFESEMFGHEAGAFTGAGKRRIGKIEHASGGTLFLDEVESMPLSMQVKLLRVLQDRRVERLGSNTPVPVDLRVVAATKEDLSALAEAGRFRKDLFFRLDVVKLTLPPLRERREDVPLLFELFLVQAAVKYQRPVIEVPPSLRRSLMLADWPGNVRELKNAAERFMLGFLGPDFAGGTAPAPGLDALLDRVERLVIEDALKAAGQRVAEAARTLGLPRKTLSDRMKRLGLTQND